VPDVEGSPEQIAYAFDVLELDGVSMRTNADGSYLGDDGDARGGVRDRAACVRETCSRGRWRGSVRRRPPAPLSVSPRRDLDRGLRQLQRTAELDGGERRGVLGASAARLIPRPAGASDSLSALERA
jgi:hypothetical protein